MITQTADIFIFNYEGRIDMKERKKLHDCSIYLIMLAIIDIISWFTSTNRFFNDGSFDEAIANVEPGLQTAVKVCLVVILVLQLALSVSQIVIGHVGLKVSSNPNAGKGYITASKVLFVLNIIAVVSVVIVLFDAESKYIIDHVLSLVASVADTLIVFFFIKAAKAVRQSVLENK